MQTQVFLMIYSFVEMFVINIFIARYDLASLVSPGAGGLWVFFSWSPRYLGFFYIFFGSLNQTFEGTRPKSYIFDYEKYQAILCHFLSNISPYQLFPLTNSFREKNSQSLKKCDFFNL